MNELGAARVIYAFANRSTQGNDSARSDNAQATTSVVYGTVAFVGDGQTSYTYTAADGTSITVTPAVGEYAVVIDSGETVIISSAMPLSVGDRVSLVYQSGRWVVVSNEATVNEIEKSKQEAINEAAKQIQDAADKAAQDTKAQVEEQLSPFREDYESFKSSHTYTDADVTKKIEDSETSTKTAYEGSIKEATQGLVTTATYESGINGVTSSINEKYTEVTGSISDANSSIDAVKDDLASNYVKNTDENYTYVRDKKSQITQTIDQVASVMGDSETLSDAVGAIAESKANSAVTQSASDIRSEVSQTYATKTEAQTMADTAESNATTAGQTAASTAEANAKADTTERLKSYSTTVEMNSAIDQKADSISSTVEQNVLSQVGQSYATKTSLTQTADELQLQIDAALTDVTVEYSTSTSSTSAPTTGWSTDSPTWTSGLYIWQRTTTYVTQKADDGTRTKTVYSQKVVCIQGARGETGEKGSTGDPGRGVSSIVTQYTRSSSSTSNSAYGGWSTTCPSYSSSYPYYWTRQYITYTTGATAYAPSSTGAYDGGLSDANKTAATASSTASSTASDLTSFKKQFTFGTNGLTVTTTAGKTILSTSYDSDGSYSINNITGMKSAHAQLMVKDWGIYYGNDKGTSGSGDDNVHFWVTEGKYGGATSGTVKYSDSPASEPAIHLGIGSDYIELTPSKGFVVKVNSSYLKLGIADLAAWFQAAVANSSTTNQLWMDSNGFNFQVGGKHAYFTSSGWA